MRVPKRGLLPFFLILGCCTFLPLTLQPQESNSTPGRKLIPGTPENFVRAGASHYAELWYVFDHLDQEPWRWSTADRKVAEEISTYWVNFARSGNPNGQGLPPWPAFTNANSEVLYLGDPITVGRAANINSLRVFDAVYTSVRGKPFAATATAVPKEDAFNRIRHNWQQERVEPARSHLRTPCYREGGKRCSRPR